jgi:hypothetical protein
MTPQERQMVDDLFDRLSKMESAPRDPDAIAAIAQGLRVAPNATYALVQTVLVQDEALRRANNRIQELESDGTPQQGQGGSFLDPARGSVFGQGQSGGSVPNVRPPEVGSRPVWNSGQVLQQTSQGHSDQERYDQGRYDQRGYDQSFGGQQAPMGGAFGGPSGGGGSFLGTAAAAAAGVVGGSLLLNGIRGMMGGGHHGFGDASALGGHNAGSNPLSDQSGSSLARDAGINNIGSSSDQSRAGLFDSASNADHDDMDMDSDEFGGDSDVA